MLCSILRNNSFYGTIPEEVVGLKEFEILDLGYINFSGLLDANVEHNISSLAIYCSSIFLSLHPFQNNLGFSIC